MIISHGFGIGLIEYAARGKSNDFPVIDKCPDCKAHGRLHRHGFYRRFGITEDETKTLFILRMKCVHCKSTFSILPDFLIPYFQHTIHTVVKGIELILRNKRLNSRRQIINFHLRRYLKILKWIHSFFAGLGIVVGFSEVNRREAIKYLKMILDFGESTFLRRSWGHLTKHFMAN